MTACGRLFKGFWGLAFVLLFLINNNVCAQKQVGFSVGPQIPVRWLYRYGSQQALGLQLYGNYRFNEHFFTGITIGYNHFNNHCFLGPPINIIPLTAHLAYTTGNEGFEQYLQIGLGAYQRIQKTDTETYTYFHAAFVPKAGVLIGLSDSFDIDFNFSWALMYVNKDTGIPENTVWPSINLGAVINL